MGNKIVKGGPLRSVSFAGREFKVTTDSDPTVVMGGVEVTQEMNGMGTHRELYMPIAWSISSVKLELDVENGDHEFLVDFQEKGGGDIVISYRSVDYVGSGNITGTLETNPANASVTLSAGGGGKIKRL
jgi:hypothetical protein